MKSLDILMFSMSPYSEWTVEHKANRNFHVLSQLAQDPRIGKIVSVDFLPHTFRRAARAYWTDHLHRHQGEVIHRSISSIFQKVDERVYTLATIDSVLSERRMQSEIVRALANLGIRRPVIWSFTPLFTSYFGSIPSSATVFDAVDDWTTHPAYSRQVVKLKKNYAFIDQNVSRIFAVTQHLVDALFPSNPRAQYIPNGVDLEHYARRRGEPEDLSRIPKPRIGYVGVIQSRVDTTLLLRCAQELPDMQFVCIGPVWPDANVTELTRRPNVHFLGQKPYDSLPAYVQHIDVGIIPHIASDLVKSMNPLKLYEYLACGKPVVTTPISGAELVGDVITVAPSAGQFIEAIRQSLASNSAEASRLRLRAIAPHSWHARVDRMVSSVLSAASIH